MVKLWMVCLTVVGVAVLMQTQISPAAANNNTTTTNSSDMYTSQPPTSWSTMNISQGTTINSTGTGGFSLHSSNLLFLPLTITASIFYLSC